MCGEPGGVSRHDPIPLRGEVKFHEPMSRHTSWRVGGTADRFFIPADCRDLAVFLRTLGPDVPVEWVGLGSNLLVRDGGIRGAVICTHRGLSELRLVGRNRIYAQAGVPSAKVARFCVRCGLGGAEFLVGIPGTFGGALAMNAGAFDGETWELVDVVQTIDRSGRVRTRDANEFIVGYRTVRMPAREWFVAAELKLRAWDSEKGRALISELLEQRSATQPIQNANAGSVFRNPPGDYAGRLIEQAGLKGASEGKACVSERHANFIINRGGATAADIERLIDRMRRQVKLCQGTRLELEVRVVGEAVRSNGGTES